MAALYIHIPLCLSRCSYCDFYSTTNTENKSLLLSGISKEIELRKEYLNGETIRTIYFGGGTPSLLSDKEIGQMLDKIFNTFDCSPEEITLEANPDDLSPQYIRALQNLPVNRISIGIQSFYDLDLKQINRRHSAQQAVESVKTCQDAGFENISIDLIYGLPGQTIELWEKNLQTAVGLQIPHLSAYHLIYEENTELFRRWKAGKILPVEEETSETMFLLLRDTLHESGVFQYEISNFAKPGMESKHNSSYWNDVPYLGVGPSAHSYNRISRQWNVADLKTYLNALDNGNSFYETESLDTYSRYNEFILISLRQMSGVDISLMSEKFGEELASYCLQTANRFISRNLLETKENRLRLTENGILISDGIMAELLWVD